MTGEQFNEIIRRLDEIILLLKGKRSTEKPQTFNYSYPISREKPDELPNKKDE